MIDRVKDDYFHFLREGVFISLIYFRSVLAFEVGKNIVVTVLSTKKNEILIIDIIFIIIIKNFFLSIL